MAARLKLCLMCHVENSYAWNRGSVPADDATARALGLLSTMVGAQGGRGAKVSVQFDMPYLDQAVAFGYPGGVTSLSLVLANGGNFWLHNHTPTYENLQSTWMTVASAFAGETVVAMSVATPSTAGRSGGASPTDSTVDWVSIMAFSKVPNHNATTVDEYNMVPLSLRPYRISQADVSAGLVFHYPAPGPIYDGAPTTLRQRPFFANNSTEWDVHINCIYPLELTAGSILVLPQAAGALAGASANRSPWSTLVPTTIRTEDLDAAFTQVWSTYKQMEDYQPSISNVWYIHIVPSKITGQSTPAIGSIGAWVDSINVKLNVPNSAVWMNMNEISSGYWNSTTAYW